MLNINNNYTFNECKIENIKLEEVNDFKKDNSNNFALK